MRFKKLDLNLLVALDALLSERNVTRAASRLHITQSTMSNALARLREYFEDELLIPVGRHMDLTPRARALEQRVREVLLGIDATIAAPLEFDPARSNREFTLFLSDFSMTSLAPIMLTLAGAQHSRVRLHLKPQLSEFARAVDRGEVDLLIVPRQFCSREHPLQELFNEEFACVVWRDSELAHCDITPELYRDALHAVMRPAHGGIVQSAFDSWFIERFGIACRAGLTAYSFSALPWLVTGTEMIATVPRHLADLLQPSAPIVIKPIPAPALNMLQTMQWHHSRNNDPGLLWLRNLVTSAAMQLPTYQAFADTPPRT